MNPLEGVDWDRLGIALQELWSAPGSNLGASLLFVAAVGILLLMFVLGGIVVVYSLALDDSDDEDEDEEDEDEGEGADDSGPVRVLAHDADTDEDEDGEQRFPRWARALVWLAFIVVTLCVFDFVAGGTDVCRSCHEKEPHARADSDPHVAVACVKCHEDRRGVAMFSSASARGMHVLSAAVQPAWSGGYGAVTANACRKCHKKQVSQTITIKAQELRVSHVEPLDAGAICTDCHLLNDDGEIAERNRGMTTCLRCHDGRRADNECAQCHEGDPSAAIRDDEKEMVFSAEVLVPDYRCGGCHTDQSKCDKCHGLRMPHSQEFVKFKHAKYGVFMKKESCLKVCHIMDECNKCHEFVRGMTVAGHAQNWTWQHGRGRSMSSPCACHAPADDPEKPFCPVCHDGNSQ